MVPLAATVPTRMAPKRVSSLGHKEPILRGSRAGAVRLEQKRRTSGDLAQMVPLALGANLDGTPIGGVAGWG
jgi:hypothetical protein